MAPRQERPLQLTELSALVSKALATEPWLVQGAWIVAETADVRTTGGHCYLELIEKDPATGRARARVRATIWASCFGRLQAEFAAKTGITFRSDLKVMVYATVAYSAVYGLSLNIVAINPEYTLGDAMRRRAEMIERLKREGIIGLNRALPWPAVPQRVAIVSAVGAAGYGDFINQLMHNPWRLRFTPRLFPALVQGERAAASIIEALGRIAADPEPWQCVVIIRGGGATSDLAAFDDYDLAAAVARMAIPVIIGIGHERDVTLLDYVANMRVKTPTAAAEWLVQRGEQALGRLQQIAAAMLQAATDRIGGCHRQLAHIAGRLPALANAALSRQVARLAQARLSLAAVADRRICPQTARLDALAKAIAAAAPAAVAAQRRRLDALGRLLDALSPQATLRRGYTITRFTDPETGSVRAAGSAADVPAGAEIITTFADGEIKSTVSAASPSAPKS